MEKEGHVRKLRRRGLDMRVAQKLVHAGLANPAQIRAATDEEILAIPSIKAADLPVIRQKVR